MRIFQFASVLFFFVALLSGSVSGQSQLVQAIFKTGTLNNFNFGAMDIHNDSILTFTSNHNAPDIFELRKMDLAGNCISLKAYKLFSSYLNQTCGPGKTWVFNPEIHYLPNDSTYLLLAKTTEYYGSCNPAPPGTNFLLVKFNTGLDTLWHREYVMKYETSALTNAGDLLVVGYNSIVKLNTSNGDTIWCRAIYTDTIFPIILFRDMVKCFEDSTYILAGSVFRNSKNCGVLVKISDSGIIHWSKFYLDSLESQEFWQISRTLDSNYMINASMTTSQNAVHFSMLKTDHNGDCIWKQNFTDPGNITFSRSFTSMHDSNYLVLYTKMDTITYQTEYFVLKLDWNGNFIQNFRFQKPAFTCTLNTIEKIFATANSGFIVTGDYYIISDTTSASCYFINYQNLVASGMLCQAADSLPINLLKIPVNWLYQYNLNRNLLYDQTINDYILLDSCVTATAISELNQDVDGKLIVFPNPALDKIQIVSTFELAAGINVFNSYGQKINVQESNIAGNKLVLDCKNWNNGLYTISVKTKQEKKYYYKLLVVH